MRNLKSLFVILGVLVAISLAAGPVCAEKIEKACTAKAGSQIYIGIMLTDGSVKFIDPYLYKDFAFTALSESELPWPPPNGPKVLTYAGPVDDVPIKHPTTDELEIFSKAGLNKLLSQRGVPVRVGALVLFVRAFDTTCEEVNSESF